MRFKKSEYLDINKNAYDLLATEFESKIKIRKNNQTRIVNRFIGFLEEYSPLAKNILELGPAAGYTTKLISEKGYQTDAIEISKKLTEICKRIAPLANVYNNEFLSHNFKNKKYSGILAVAFIHLFPKTQTHKVLAKIHSLLSEKGIAYISTTVHSKPTEGYERKRNFDKENIRFRRRFSRNDLEEELIKAGFFIINIETTIDTEEKNKEWMNYVVGLSPLKQ